MEANGTNLKNCLCKNTLPFDYDPISFNYIFRQWKSEIKNAAHQNHNIWSTEPHLDGWRKSYAGTLEIFNQGDSAESTMCVRFRIKRTGDRMAFHKILDMLNNRIPDLVFFH
jgi:hypothetical protein